jgi:3-methyladenine DNA glycosylase/8-oxoguanine DNA glycosylase
VNRLTVDPEFSLAATCGPVAWGKGRWPNVDWIDGGLVWVGREGGAVVTRSVRHPAPGQLAIDGAADSAGDEAWLRAVLAIDRTPPEVTDPVVTSIAARFTGLRPFNSGSLFDGIVSCIAGQSITVAAAAVTEARICALFHPAIELHGRRFWPMPLPNQIADSDPALIRTTGVTWKRAEAIVAAAIAWENGELPNTATAMSDPDGARTALRRLPLVGEWTAESALLWGIGLADAFPPNDAALLRAARLAYANPEMTHRDLVQLAGGWRPGRAWASRWLWTALLGPAPT